MGVAGQAACLDVEVGLVEVVGVVAASDVCSVVGLVVAGVVFPVCGLARLMGH